jgi:hypothetical protein
MSSPTARTLADLRGDGYRAEVVERWNQHARIRQDLFDFIDIVAIRGTDTLAVQATSTGNMGARLTKIKGLPAAREWVEGGRFLSIVGWKKYKKRVDGKQWRATWRPVTLEDFQ